MNAISISTCLNIIFIFFSSVVCLGQTKVKIIYTGNDAQEITQTEMYPRMSWEPIPKSFQDTSHYEFTPREMVDLYTINYFKGEERFSTKLWLDQGPSNIYVHVRNGNLHIDSVHNSLIYNKVIQFYKDLNLIQPEDKNAFFLTSFKENQDNLFSLEIASQFLNQNPQYKAALPEMKRLLESQGNTYYGHVDHQNLMDKIHGLLEVDHINLTQYTFLDVAGKTSKLKKIPRTKYYLVDFWFVGCVPCREDHKKIKENYPLFDQEHVAIVGLSIDKNEKLWNDYLQEHDYAWPNYRVEKGSSIISDLGVGLYPTYYLFDADLNFQGIYSNIEDFGHLFLNKAL